MPRPIEFPHERQRYAEYRFCPRCGTPFGAEGFRPAEALFMCGACGFDFYQNPSPASVVVIPHPRDDAKVLMLRRRTAPNVGLWCVPGGFIRYGEMPADAAAREAREEVGLTVRIERVLRAGLVDYTYRGRQICVVEVAFLGRLQDDVRTAELSSPEASEVAFHSLPDVLANPSIMAFPEQLEVLRAYQPLAVRRAPSQA